MHPTVAGAARREYPSRVELARTNLALFTTRPLLSYCRYCRPQQKRRVAAPMGDAIRYNRSSRWVHTVPKGGTGGRLACVTTTSESRACRRRSHCPARLTSASAHPADRAKKSNTRIRRSATPRVGANPEQPECIVCMVNDHSGGRTNATLLQPTRTDRGTVLYRITSGYSTVQSAFRCLVSPRTLLKRWWRLF